MNIVTKTSSIMDQFNEIDQAISIETAKLSQLADKLVFEHIVVRCGSYI